MRDNGAGQVGNDSTNTQVAASFGERATPLTGRLQTYSTLFFGNFVNVDSARRAAGMLRAGRPGRGLVHRAITEACPRDDEGYRDAGRKPPYDVSAQEVPFGANYA